MLGLGHSCGSGHWDGSGKDSGLTGAIYLKNHSHKAIMRKVKVKSLSSVRLLATPWTAAHQAPPSMGFSRQEYWSGVPLPSPSLYSKSSFKKKNMGFLGGSVVKNPPVMWETWVPSLGWEDPLEKGKDYPLQYSGLENSMDCTVYEVTFTFMPNPQFHYL